MRSNVASVYKGFMRRSWSLEGDEKKILFPSCLPQISERETRLLELFEVSYSVAKLFVGDDRDSAEEEIRKAT
jgi:hypothetical protein